MRAGQAKSLAEIEADMKKASVHQSPSGGDSPAHSGSGPGTPSHTAHPGGIRAGGGGSHNSMYQAPGAFYL